MAHPRLHATHAASAGKSEAIQSHTDERNIICPQLRYLHITGKRESATHAAPAGKNEAIQNRTDGGISSALNYVSTHHGEEGIGDVNHCTEAGARREHHTLRNKYGGGGGGRRTQYHAWP